MLIAICADKGSPGVTTAALVLASAWSSPAVVVEADPAGGDLGIRLRHAGSVLPEAPTVLTVATAARSNGAEDLIAGYAHRLTSVVSVIPGAILREQMAGVGDWEPLADVGARSDVPVIVDLGHLHHGSKALTLAARAAVVVVVGRPDATSVIRMRERLSCLASDLGELRGSPPQLFALLVTPNRHGPGHVADLRRILDETAAKPFLVGSGFLALDPSAVRRVEIGEDPTRRLARTNLMRSARVVAASIAQSVDLQRSERARASASGGQA